MIPDDASYKLEDIFKKRVLPLISDLKKDFFLAVEGSDNVDLKTGISMMTFGLRMMMKRNPKYADIFRKANEEKSNIEVKSVDVMYVGSIERKSYAAESKRKDIYD